uniref:Otopetrin-2 n=1 Tax=Lygus hesperus TaxID=30085 RepID=A0A0A9Y1V3_LYGHE
MQRCPYLHEMKERLLHQGSDHMLLEPVDTEVLDIHNDGTGGNQCVATIVKLNADGYGSHTSPTHHLLPAHYHHETDNTDHHLRPKNAKTSLFIIMSFIYAKLLVVICIAYVVSEVVTHSLPLVYYEGFFTYLYGASILFLLYVFCFLLQESSCCQGAEPKPPKPKKQKKEKENKKNQKKEKEEKEKEKKEREKSEKEKKEKEKKDKKDSKKDGKDKEKDKGKVEPKVEDVAPPPPPPPQGQRNSRSNIFQNEVYPRKMRDVVRQKSLSDADNVTGMGTLKKSKSGGDQSQERLTDGLDIESAAVVPVAAPQGRKRKTSQNSNSHGSFFLRVGAIAFGLATMIYNGLEFGAFFEIPFNSSCYQILRGVNPILQMIFTFMQMYFIFMNSRLNIHRFKLIARFGLMHIVATNLCVWIRTLVLESLKEISTYLDRKNLTATAIPPLTFLQHRHPELNSALAKSSAHAHHIVTTMPTTVAKFAGIFERTARTVATTTTKAVTTTIATTLPTIMTTTPTTTRATTTTTMPTTMSTTKSTPLPYFIRSTINPFINSFLGQNTTSQANMGVHRSFPSWDEIGDSPLAPEALVDQRSLSSGNCERTNIMGTIVQDSAPYLFPFIIEYSLIGAAVIYVMWRHIGKNPRYHGDEDLEHRLEVILSRRAVAMAHVQQGGRMDCVGASKGLFFGLLLLVGSLICLILFFVLIHNPQLSLLAIYLADASHCILMILSIFAIIIGFIRIQNLKFRVDEQNDLNDILLRVSAFGLFVYAVFSIISGSLTAMTSEPNLLVTVTGVLAVLQVVLQLLFISDISRRRVHLPEHDRSKPGRQIVTFLLIVNVTMWVIYTFETQKVVANPVQLEFYGFLAWSMVQRITLPLCIFHRFHSAVTLAEIWKTSYKPRID